MAATIRNVRKNIYRIDCPHTNGGLTRSGGYPTPKLLGRIFKAIARRGKLPCDPLCLDIDFRRGNNTRKWYFELTRKQ